MKQLFIALLVPLVLLSCNQQTETVTVKQLTVYDRITKAEKIQAAYITYPPACMKNTITGEMSGIFVDVLEKACENLGLELEWTEEVGWAAQIEGLESDRYDIVGSPVWANPVRGTKTTMSAPVYYSGIGVYVRADDDRFDGYLVNYRKAINKPSVKIGTVDGETADLIARSDFPEAERYSSPQLTDISQKFLDLETKKCDVIFAEPYYAYEYLKNNPGTVKNIAEQQPIRLFGNCYMFKKGEFQMKHMLDVAIQDLINSGYVETIIKIYEPAPNLFYRVAPPYQPIGQN